MKTIRFGTRKIGDLQPVFIIAEAGVNHNDSLEAAKELIVQAKRSGADCVKFQTFTAEEVATVTAPKARYQRQTTDPKETQFEMLKKLELSPRAHLELKKLADREKIFFMSTPYNEKDADLLESVGVEAYKLASIHVVEPHFLRYVAKKKKPVILSTGMANRQEIRQGVDAVFQTGNRNLVLLQCTTNYPSPVEDANLRVIPALRKQFGILSGYSDHTTTAASAAAAVALGACVVEKHFTLDRNLPGPDHSCSFDPKDFSLFVKVIRESEASLGTGKKIPSDAEKINAREMRRSIVAKDVIPAGTALTLEHLTLKRPAYGMLGSRLHRLIGKKTVREVQKDELITADLLK